MTAGAVISEAASTGESSFFIIQYVTQATLTFITRLREQVRLRGQSSVPKVLLVHRLGL